jgi:hypothetical protein
MVGATAFQTEKPVLCNNTSIILRSMELEYKEKLIWTGQDSVGIHAVFHNAKTGTWTILQLMGETSCVLGVGGKSTLIYEKIQQPMRPEN